MATDYFDKPICLTQAAALLGLRVSVLKNASLKNELLPGEITPPKRHAIGYSGFYFCGQDVKRCIHELKK